MGFKIAHIETGLRSFSQEMPEEINRIIVDKISDVLFCPTKNALSNIRNEGFISPENYYKVFDIGDVMLDSFLLFEDVAQYESKVIKKVLAGSRKNFSCNHT